ncbi:hypothetical protein PR202_ga18531 [Eleusine coracana subsp. coracana]|uniref:C2 domain-containing protein n=1 Tax=Eleusine coracana subsp. coracana TaxID=191504 RepID=A0AAV5CT30_ELECO|nr:hypothetical protein PR202_ga18531 [Eleusine coracana subsp. coracana]
MAAYKLGVEVVSAHDLMPKDGQGSASACVELTFDGQRFRTAIKEKDLNPVWNEHFYFNVSDPSNLPELALEAYVYNVNKSIEGSRSFLGKVRIAGTSFVPFPDAVVMHYPLEKRGMFSRVKGELGLKVYITNDPTIKASNPLLAMNPVSNIPHAAPTTPAEQIAADIAGTSLRTSQEHRSEVKTLHTIAKEVHHHQQHGHLPASFGEHPSKYPVEHMKPEHQPPKFILFVRVVKARELPDMDLTGSLDPFVEVRVGNYRGITRHFEKNKNPEWNAVFAFSRDRMQASVLEVLVKDKDLLKDDFVGLVRFDLNDVPIRVPPDSPLAPEWYRLVSKSGDKSMGELMLAVWIGTQADEAFPDAWHSDAATLEDPSAVTHMKSKVYHAPRLWYLRVNIIEAQDVAIFDRTRFPDAFVRAQVGHQIGRTKPVQARNFNPFWNEDLMFVAAEPFEDHLVLTLEDRAAPNKDEILGRVIIPLTMIDRRADDRIVHGKWFNLEKPVLVDVDQLKEGKVLYSASSPSDLRPTAKQLWKPAIGLLELGILGAQGIVPMKTRDGKGSSDTYCVAKYGSKWVRTRTIMNNPNPKFNEQYTWEVYDPATVLTVGVFDNGQLGEKSGEKTSSGKDGKIGKVRIRLSTLETGRVYTHSYPLLVLHPSGVKKMGELHLAIRFSSTSLVNMLYLYSRPLLPKMHYARPIPVLQVDMLRHQAVQIVAARLSRMEPPLRKEVVEYMTDFDSHLWSMRRSKANFFRLMSVFLRIVCRIWNFRYRPRYPPHMNTKISHAEAVHPDELDEEFDTFPTSRNPEIIRMRYDRLRSVAGRIQTVVGDIATQGERVQALLSWRDPRATSIFVLFCLVAAIVLYVTPLQVLAALGGFYVMRHPRTKSL